MATTTTTTIVPRVFQGQDEPMLDQENEHLKANQQSDQAYPDAASRRGSASLTKFSKHGFDLVGLIKADSSSVENAMNMVSGTGKVLAEKSDAKTLLGTPNSTNLSPRATMPTFAGKGSRSSADNGSKKPAAKDEQRQACLNSPANFINIDMDLLRKVAAEVDTNVKSAMALMAMQEADGVMDPDELENSQEATEAAAEPSSEPGLATRTRNGAARLNDATRDRLGADVPRPFHIGAGRVMYVDLKREVDLDGAMRRMQRGILSPKSIQYRAILRRRTKRVGFVEYLAMVRKRGYLHESRSKHARERVRGDRGKFLKGNEQDEDASSESMHEVVTPIKRDTARERAERRAAATATNMAARATAKKSTQCKVERSDADDEAINQRINALLSTMAQNVETAKTARTSKQNDEVLARNARNQSAIEVTGRGPNAAEPAPTWHARDCDVDMLDAPLVLTTVPRMNFSLSNVPPFSRMQSMDMRNLTQPKLLETTSDALMLNKSGSSDNMSWSSPKPLCSTARSPFLSFNMRPSPMLYSTSSSTKPFFDALSSTSHRLESTSSLGNLLGLADKTSNPSQLLPIDFNKAADARNRFFMGMPK